MQKEIVLKLNGIEKAEGIRILYATESGSRAWGFESENSDYDVRFIYLRPYTSYLSLDKLKDTLEFPINNDLDICGWDFKKALLLLYKSNPALFEWLNSPITYIETEFTNALREVSNDYFNQRNSLYHYINIVKNHYKLINGEEFVPLKKYFYCIRPILCSKWIITYRSVPPVPFDKLLHLLDNELIPIINELIVLKKEQKEKDVIKKIDPLNRYIENSIINLGNNITTIPNSENNNKKLDDLFIKVLKEYGGLGD